MKTLIAFFAGALVVSCMSKECSAQQAPTVTTFVNPYGQPVATVQQIGTTTFVSNQYGQLVSSGRTFNEAIVIPAQPIQLQNVLPTVPTLPMIGVPR